MCWGWKKADGTEDGTTVNIIQTADNGEPTYYVCYAIAERLILR